MREEISLAGKKVVVYKFSAGGSRFSLSAENLSAQTTPNAPAPVIFFNAFKNEADEVARILDESEAANFTLAAISGLEWGAEMTPWSAPPIFKKEPPFAGEADEYLRLLTNEIAPAVLQKTGEAAWLGIAGYSLAGLFALYAIYKTPIFRRAASVSGSLWYEGFKEFALGSPLAGGLERAYLSIGELESAGKNERLKDTLSNTRELAAHYEKLGVKSKFELNEGGHFNDEAGRIAKAIVWLAEEN